ncbi:(Fe-S)-binding protein [Candidatus Lokiarchaeum ossiferum]|uniref:(Fe-S)-binding protein n=1 Tax=Candidatus Lokiarchaeum ossiferum TaxID=2951803 RepID=UPI00352CCE52
MLTNTSSQMQQHVTQCINCGQCNLVCPTHIAGIFNPLGVLRDLQMHDPETAIANQPIYNCLTCNRCMTFCPASKNGVGMNIAMLIRYLRAYAIENQLKSPEKNEFPGSCTTLANSEKSDSIPTVDSLQYFKNTPKLKIAQKGEIAYFIGNLAGLEDLNKDLGLNLSEIPQSVVGILNRVNISPVVLNMNDSGHDDLWAGNIATFRKIAQTNVDLYKKAGVTTVIVEGAEAYRTWKFDYPKAVKSFGLKVYHLSEYLLNENLVKKLVFDNSFTATYAFQDSSRLGRLGGNHYEEPRSILGKIPGNTLIELESTQTSAFDYAGGLHIVENSATEEMWKQRLHEVQETGVQYFITTSPKAIVQYSKFDSDIPIKDWAVFLSRFLK